MTKEDEWIDIEKTRNIDEVRNTKEYKNWVKNIKERIMNSVFYAGPTSIWRHITYSHLRILFSFALSRTTA